MDNLRPPCHDYANPTCGAKQHPLIIKYPNMPDNYKKDLQDSTVNNRAINEPLQSNNVQENNILLVKHFDDNFPI